MSNMHSTGLSWTTVLTAARRKTQNEVSGRHRGIREVGNTLCSNSRYVAPPAPSPFLAAVSASLLDDCSTPREDAATRRGGGRWGAAPRGIPRRRRRRKPAGVERTSQTDQRRHHRVDGFIQPIVFTMSLYQVLLFGTTYSIYTNMQSIFSNPPYNFSSEQVGLLFLVPGLGF